MDLVQQKLSFPSQHQGEVPAFVPLQECTDISTAHSGYAQQSVSRRLLPRSKDVLHAVGVQICPANLDSCSPSHPASSNNVPVVSLSACFPSLGITHGIPWKSCSLAAEQIHDVPRILKMREVQIQLCYNLAASSTVLLPLAVTCYRMVHRLGCKSWTTNPIFTWISSAFGTSRTDRGTMYGQQKPGRLGMEVCGYCAHASDLLSTSDLPPKHGAACTWDVPSTAFMSDPQRTHGQSHSRVNHPKPHCRIQHNKLFFSLASLCLDFAASFELYQF